MCTFPGLLLVEPDRHIRSGISAPYQQRDIVPLGSLICVLKIDEQLSELRRWYDATLGQGMRNIELKRDVNELLKQAGQPPRYPSAEQSDAE